MIIAQAKPIDYEKAIATAKGKAPDKPVVHLGKQHLRKIWDNYEIIADVKTDDNHFVRVAIGTLDGGRYINLREFYYHLGDDTFKPGKNGMRIPMIAPFYEGKTVPTIKDVGKEFMDSFIKAFEAVQTMPLADPKNAMYISKHYSKTTAIKAKETSNNENQQP